ncbi:hypothetical protein OG496_55260 [Streptomyces sp. NBC_00988]|uniref:hypothetical protein n=1 Tax=Streptomyces sp. NBC_00988 TaxID=2903704 RepID=UPI00386D525A|nr:hypothetical protein OG496_00025 [Streptomyces sp. NBC_00988]WSX17751.1 hypothetical protein OG496_55260 [Streptomyces sp. NBC_00988]
MPQQNAQATTRASEPVPEGVTSPSPAAPAGIGMAQALVVLGFVAAAVVLRLAAGMSMRDSVTLLAAAGAIGVAVLLAVGFPRGGGGRSLLRRLLKAALTPGSGN